jgi:hypothetical protein
MSAVLDQYEASTAIKEIQRKLSPASSFDRPCGTGIHSPPDGAPQQLIDEAAAIHADEAALDAQRKAGRDRANEIRARLQSDPSAVNVLEVRGEMTYLEMESLKAEVALRERAENYNAAWEAEHRHAYDRQMAERRQLNSDLLKGLLALGLDETRIRRMYDDGGEVHFLGAVDDVLFAAHPDYRRLRHISPPTSNHSTHHVRENAARLQHARDLLTQFAIDAAGLS